jgi:TRAP-type C4-dicarboxylate transport system permease small subunit
MIRIIDGILARTLAAARWLALPLSLLLFLQWPLRDLVHAGSRQANDMAQCFFALYVALSITDATRRASHLAPRPLAPAWAARWRRPLRAAGLLLALLPWSLFVLVSSATQVWQSVSQLESFPDTFNPGYFIVKLALWLLAAAVLLQALIDLARLDGEGH